MNVSPAQIKKFRETIWNYYKTSGRENLPWRKNINPYRVWVSEVMLQQTQVDRVVNFFNAWIKSFPTVKKLAEASQIEVLKLWKGLGYNSRAIRMKKTAELIMHDYKGKFPNNYALLQKLPGIGPYTAGAISAFANNQPVVIIETNIRRVFIHHFFADQSNIHDEAILELVKKTLDTKNPREWYWALMDYGSFLGRTLNIKGKKYNPNVQSKHYTKQSKFTGSDREIRGKILEILLHAKNNSVTDKKLQTEISNLSKDEKRIAKILNELHRDGFIEIVKNKISLKG
jgi:A/G-specific adenine glycosylase